MRIVRRSRKVNIGQVPNHHILGHDLYLPTTASHLVCLVYLVEPDQPNQPDEQNKPAQSDEGREPQFLYRFLPDGLLTRHNAIDVPVGPVVDFGKSFLIASKLAGYCSVEGEHAGTGDDQQSLS